MSTLRYLFYPNPGAVQYGDASMLGLLALCAGLVLASIAIRYWRRGLQNPVTRKLSRSWAAASLWFGLAGLVLVVSRVEGIQFIAMRFLWVLWIVGVLVYVFFQVRFFTSRHYAVLPKVRVEDPRDRYIPGRKKH